MQAFRGDDEGALRPVEDRDGVEGQPFAAALVPGKDAAVMEGEAGEVFALKPTPVEAIERAGLHGIERGEVG